MSATTAARKLKDINRWKLKPFTPRPVVSGIAYDNDTARGDTTDSLPFPVDAVLTDRVAGVETMSGADQLIELWASWLAWALDTSAASMDGPWLVQQLEEHRDLHPLPDPKAFPDDPDMAAWAAGFLPEWDRFTTELVQLWWRLGNLTGNAPLRRSLCPKCKSGWLESLPDKDGYSDEATCTSRQCGATIDYNAAEYLASFRAVMRSEDVPQDRYLTLTEICTIWPRLPAGTLRRWVHEGHVHKHGGRYNLADVNTRMWTRHVIPSNA